ncbi:MAG: hypothetical protein HC857_13145 [Synechococcales cyanobacterium RU_4_20]|nr:hypothetical protein [Synechococcales cyanobacterium RU_4_20]
MSYQHPGYAFLAQHEPIRQEADLLAYVSFLLESAGLDGEPPVDLGQIYRHFEMPQPQRASPHGTARGFWWMAIAVSFSSKLTIPSCASDSPRGTS